jgi:YVTN family beta-propeller protein
VNPAGTRVYVTNINDKTISVIDATTNTVIATVPSANVELGIAVNPSGTRVYVTNSPTNISVLDTVTNAIIATPGPGYNYGPQGIAVTPDGTRIYVVNLQSGNVSVFDTATNAMVATVSVGSRPIGFGQFIGPSSEYSRNYVQEAYVAYYGRPADPSGQSFWAGRMDAEGQSLNAIIGAFGYSDEFNRRYGGLSYAALVTKIYQQALNRDPDPAGLAYYVGELQAGRRTLQAITLDVLNGATTAPDSTVVANKLDVAAYYTGKVATGCGYGTEQDGVNSLAGVTAQSSTVTAAKAGIDTRCGP